MSAAAAPGGRGEDPAALIAMLGEQSPVYDGLGSGEAERVRARLFLALADSVLPPAALPFILEELETGSDRVATAAAAIALRGAAGPVPEAEALLLKAMDRLTLADAPFTPRPGRTALQEVVATLAGLPSAGEASRQALGGLLASKLPAPGARAEAERALAALDRRGDAPAISCCARPSRAEPVRPLTDAGPTRLQDQSGARLSFADFFHAEPAVLAFFYTRCMNPERCSLTVSKLARLQAGLGRRGLAGRVRVAAITYDPAFDLPSRLRAYGADRGFRFDARNRFFRTDGPVDPLRSLFDLGVGYGPSTVNRHRLELFVLDAGGALAASFTRRLWDEEEVADAVAALADRQEASPASSS
jgi:cytochrome oxidase Cu insertion factor (SCO1/SenC/PrrC family)